jgi:hypothetical protein
LSVDTSSFHADCNLDSFVAVARVKAPLSENPKLAIQSSDFLTEVTIVDFQVYVRDSRFSGPAGLVLIGDDITHDLGSASSAGNNVFYGEDQLLGLRVFGEGNVVAASGNTWAPNEQGADANGRYPVGHRLLNETGRNVQFLLGNNNVVEF